MAHLLNEINKNVVEAKVFLHKSKPIPEQLSSNMSTFGYLFDLVRSNAIRINEPVPEDSALWKDLGRGRELQIWRTNVFTGKFEKYVVKVFKADIYGLVIEAVNLYDMYRDEMVDKMHELVTGGWDLEQGHFWYCMKAAVADVFAFAVQVPIEMPVQAAKKISQELAENLMALHSIHWSQRDIKPANLLVSRDAKSRLADPGHASLFVPGMGTISATGTEGYINFTEEDKRQADAELSQVIKKGQRGRKPLNNNVRLMNDIRDIQQRRGVVGDKRDAYAKAVVDLQLIGIWSDNDEAMSLKIMSDKSTTHLEHFRKNYPKGVVSGERRVLMKAAARQMDSCAFPKMEKLRKLLLLDDQDHKIIDIWFLSAMRFLAQGHILPACEFSDAVNDNVVIVLDMFERWKIDEYLGMHYLHSGTWPAQASKDDPEFIQMITKDKFYSDRFKIGSPYRKHLDDYPLKSILNICEYYRKPALAPALVIASRLFDDTMEEADFLMSGIKSWERVKMSIPSKVRDQVQIMFEKAAEEHHSLLETADSHDGAQDESDSDNEVTGDVVTHQPGSLSDEESGETFSSRKRKAVLPDAKQGKHNPRPDDSPKRRRQNNNSVVTFQQPKTAPSVASGPAATPTPRRAPLGSLLNSGRKTNVEQSEAKEARRPAATPKLDAKLMNLK